MKLVRYHGFMVKRVAYFKFFTIALVAGFAFAFPGMNFSDTAQAQQSSKPNLHPGPKLGVGPDESDKNGPEAPIAEQDLSLDDLFARLKQEADAKKAQPIERAIWRHWEQSGSETVDLLMDWSAKAMTKQDWAAALDLLDQVIVLAPQYAEGWNRRATVYFITSSYGRSLHDIEQVLKLETRHFGAMAGLSNILQKLDEDKRALVMWKNLLEIYPAHKSANHRVAELEEKLSGQGI